VIRRSPHRRDRPRSDPGGEGPGSAPLTVCLIILGAVAAGCGKKGPPLPPLLKVPAAPAEITASRGDDHVIVQLTVPSVNTDNTRPANVSRVDVYGFTGPATVTDDQLLKHGTRVGSVDVKAPRDPNQTVEPEESQGDVEAPVGEGLEQGTRARVEERLTAAVLMPVDLTTAAGKKRPAGPRGKTAGPLLGPMGVPPRTYVAVGINKRGRKGPLSTRVAVPLVPPPPAPATPAVAYGETTITVTWVASGENASQDALPSHPLGVEPPTLAYNVYEVPAPPAAETRLTTAPVAETRYTDSRVAFGTERCYAVRAVATSGGLSVESGEQPAKCVTLVDTFPPAAPKGLSGVASEAAISLIWEPNSEKDLAGYLVLRGVPPGDNVETLTQVTPAPIQATIFNDAVQPGVRYVYAIVAVDKAGNRSAPSNRFEEAAR
jgi:predicted small lipoprotein YifL